MTIPPEVTVSQLRLLSDLSDFLRVLNVIAKWCGVTSISESSKSLTHPEGPHKARREVYSFGTILARGNL
jgi:hypothetical protein